jgi:hypothetical protein
MEVSGQLHAPSALPQGESPWYTPDRWLGVPRNRSGHGVEKKNSQPMPEFDPSIIQPEAQGYTAELTQFMDTISFHLLLYLYLAQYLEVKGLYNSKG